MKKLICALALLTMVSCTSTAFALVGDTYNPVLDFSMTDPAPWQYLCQEGTGVWDGTYDFDQMIVRNGQAGNMWSAPHSADFYGWQCGMYNYYGNLGVNSYKIIVDETRTYGIGILGFTAPEGGDYKIKGGASGMAGCAGSAWINKEGPGMLWSGAVNGDYTTTNPQFDLTVNLAAGQSVYFGNTMATGNSVYGLWETYPVYWQATVTQTSDQVIPTVPEPGSILALGSGLLGLAGFVIRRKH